MGEDITRIGVDLKCKKEEGRKSLASHFRGKGEASKEIRLWEKNGVTREEKNGS